MPAQLDAFREHTGRRRDCTYIVKPSGGCQGAGISLVQFLVRTLLNGGWTGLGFWMGSRKMALPDGRRARGEPSAGYAELWGAVAPVIARRAAL